MINFTPNIFLDHLAFTKWKSRDNNRVKAQELLRLHFFLIGIVGGGVQLGPLGTASTNGLLCQPRVIMMEKLVEWLAGKPKYSEKTCPSAALSNTNPTRCPDANPDRRGGKPATNRLSYGTANCYAFLAFPNLFLLICFV
jgi:hypothetical protein